MFKLAQGLMDTINKGFNAIKNLNVPSMGIGLGATGTPNNFMNYFGRVGKVESAGKYDAVNKFSGAMGKYQFMPNTLKSLGFNVSSQQFLSNPMMQEQAMQKFTMQNIQIANKQGFNINPYNLDKRSMGVLSAMHYGGAGALKKLNNPNYMNRMQAGGHMPVSQYLQRVTN